MNNQFIESFFDTNESDFKLWSKNVANEKLDHSKIIYQGEMLKINRKNNKTKTRYFILTEDKLYYLKKANQSKIRGIMDTSWVRIQYMKENKDDGVEKTCVRFIKNMKYCDFIIKG